VDEHLYWQAVVRRDASFDGMFVFAVKTTGVYCRPSCASRQPRRENVQFFTSSEQAQEHGYRPCKRCGGHADSARSPQADLIANVCRYLEQPHDHLPTLQQLAAKFAVSPFHLQRTFKRIVGVSPRQYADTHRQQRLKATIKEAETILDAAYQAGYNTSSTLYAQAEDILGMKPSTYQRGGEAVTVIYSIVPCRLGYLLVAATEVGICKISLGDTPTQLTADMMSEFPKAELQPDHVDLGKYVKSILAYIDGEPLSLDMPLDIQGTAFQRKVWNALRGIHYGMTRSYTEIATAIGQPSAARAVASACASNRIALVIPCHRVVRSGGELGGYRWGIERKRELLMRENMFAVEDR